MAVGMGRGRRALQWWWYLHTIIVVYLPSWYPRHREASPAPHPVAVEESEDKAALRLQGWQGSVAGGSVAGMGRRARRHHQTVEALLGWTVEGRPKDRRPHDRPPPGSPDQQRPS